MIASLGDVLLCSRPEHSQKTVASAVPPPAGMTNANSRAICGRGYFTNVTSEKSPREFTPRQAADLHMYPYVRERALSNSPYKAQDGQDLRKPLAQV